MNKLTMETVKAVYEAYLASCGYSRATMASRLYGAKVFFAFIRNQYGEIDFRDLGRREIEAYMEYLRNRVSAKTGAMYARGTRRMFSTALTQVFRSLYQAGLILANPMRDVELRPAGGKSRRPMFTEEEMNAFLDNIDASTGVGLKERACFELLYSSGLRVGELCRLAIGDVDFDAGRILIREAKWGKERL